MKKEELENLLENAYEEISSAPNGRIRIRKHHQHFEFYHRKDPQDKEGIYIPAKDRSIAERLIQKGYLESLCKAAKSQLDLINSFLEQYDKNALKKVYEAENDYRKPFLQPLEMPDEMFAATWLAIEYEHLGFPDDYPVHVTEKNERVRSKSEVLIADALNHAGIPYKYECPLNIRGRTVYPDFTILRPYDREILYWEHLGMLDDMDYRNTAIRKIRSYESEGIILGLNLIITAETVRMPINHWIIDRKIQHHLLPHI